MSNLDVRHPEDGLLLRYLDGELPGRKARQVRTHLETCWQCRAQVDELEATIGECVRYRQNVLAPSLPPPPEPWRSLDFARADSELAGELAAQSWFTRLARFRSPRQNPGLRWALSGTAVVALCFVLVQQLRETPKVEAAALLQKAVRAAQSRPAAHKRLRITTRTGQMTRVIGVAYKPAARETEIARLFDAAHYDWNDPLSAQSFSAWRDRLPHLQDAIASQPNSYEIKTTTEDSELVSATLKLRGTDLEPLEGRFEFRNRDWVEMTELVDQQTNPASTVAGTTGGVPRQPGVPPGPLDIPMESANPRRSPKNYRSFPRSTSWARTWAIPSKSAGKAGRCWCPAPGFRPNGNNRFTVCWTACPTWWCGSTTPLSPQAQCRFNRNRHLVMRPAPKNLHTRRELKNASVAGRSSSASALPSWIGPIRR